MLSDVPAKRQPSISYNTRWLRRTLTEDKGKRARASSKATACVYSEVYYNIYLSVSHGSVPSPFDNNSSVYTVLESESHAMVGICPIRFIVRFFEKRTFRLCHHYGEKVMGQERGEKECRKERKGMERWNLYKSTDAVQGVLVLRPVTVTVVWILVEVKTLVLLTVWNGVCNRISGQQLPCSYTTLLCILPSP